MEGGAGLDAFMRADREFHLSSYAGAASSEMWQIIHRMWNTTQHYRREFTRLAMADGLSATHLEHRLLLDCIRRQDRGRRRAGARHAHPPHAAGTAEAPGNLRVKSQTIAPSDQEEA